MLPPFRTAGCLSSFYILHVNDCGVKRIVAGTASVCYDGENTVFIDDSLTNLKGAAALGITPVLIAANPASDVETEYAKIYRLEDLFR